MIMCNKCWEVFKEDSERWSSCPKIGCDGIFIPMDENLLEACKILSKKNYVVMCGELEKQDNYWFELYIDIRGKHDFDDLPKDYGVLEDCDDFGDITTIKMYFATHEACSSSIELQKKIWKVAQDILEWVEALEPYVESDSG